MDCCTRLLLISLSEYALAAITATIKNRVIPCNISTKVKEEDSGKAESIIYLLPMTANKDPTLRPKRESILSAWMKKQIKEIKKARYMPRNIFQNKPVALLAMERRTLNVLYCDSCFSAPRTPNAVSYKCRPEPITQLSIVHPRRVKRLSKCAPRVSATNTSDDSSNCEFSIDRRSFCWSKGKFSIFQESFITHCSFMYIKTMSPELSIVENDLSTVFAWGTSRLFTKSKFLFLYRSHNQKVIAYSFCLKSISWMLVI